ncbi:MAG TPA: hypothetical protein VKX17_28340 [Planctomycetota bacterium]|nr:hypothetical protein [Planctomycetota bacterium]
MAIEFKCSSCGKALFAQEQYAGMSTTCPGCQLKMLIPAPAASRESTTRDAAEPSPSNTPEKISVVPDSPQSAPPEPVPAVIAKVPDSPQPEPTKRCPYCAERILAAAKKCRYCGELLDDELRREEEKKRREANAAVLLAAAGKSDGIWRMVSIFMTMLTAGWLVALTVNNLELAFSKSLEPGLARPPWTVFAFDIPLIFGLFMLMRQMRRGPYHVFLSAAFAIVVCMPLTIALGLPIPVDLELLRKQGDFYKNFTEEDARNTVMIVTTMIGLLFSAPVWFTALKLFAQSRIRARSKNP